MKRLTVVACAVVMMWVSGTFAEDTQQSRRGGFGFALGHFSPTSEDFQDSYGGGINLAGEVNLPIGERSTLCFGVDYFSAHESVEAGFIGAADGDISVIPLTATWVLRIAEKNSKVMPYVGAGVGLYLWQEKSTGHLFGEEFKVSNDGNCLGYQLVGGIEIGGSTSFFCQVKYSKAEDKTEIAIGDEGFESSSDLGGTTFSLGLRFWGIGKKK